VTFTRKRCEPTITIDLQGYIYISLSLRSALHRWEHRCMRLAFQTTPLSVITVRCMLSLGAVIPSIVSTTPHY
jgi:hypothetical protein